MSYINENITCPQLLKRQDKKNENKRNMLELSIYLSIYLFISQNLNLNGKSVYM